ncbi:hypothetical protein WDU94_001046 [Cyamophila willieti]
MIGNSDPGSKFTSSQIREAARIGEQFTKLYYESMDKKRSVMGKLYKDEDSVLSWNGYGTKGSEAIVKYISELPSCDHELKSMDIQLLPDEAAPNQIAYLISTAGTVRYKNMKKTAFNQNFIISAEGTKWKIISDVFRLQETPTNMT